MDMLLSYITEPISHEFMRHALILSVFIGIVCSLFSCFLVLKGWALMGDAVSHAVLPGLILAYLFGLPLVIGAFGAGLFCAVGTGFLTENSRVKSDAVLGIVFSGMFALGLVMMTNIETDLHLMHILFGNVLGVSTYDLYETLTISTLCSLIILIKRKDLMLYCFDPDQAAVVGLPVQRLHFTFLILLVMTIVSALKAAGIILVIAMLIAPGATAFMLTRSFGMMMVLAVCVSVISCVIGTIASYHIDASTAPLIVVVQAGFFCLALAAYKLREIAGRKTITKGKLHVQRV